MAELCRQGKLANLMLASNYALGRAQWTFDAECQKCFCVTFDKSNKTASLIGIRNARKKTQSLALLA